MPDNIRGEPNAEEFDRLGQGIARLKIPSKITLQQELAEGYNVQALPRWSPRVGGAAFEATGDAVAHAGNGQILVVPPPHHIPQLVSDELNHVLPKFMQTSDDHRVARGLNR